VLGDVRYKLASSGIYDYWSDGVRLVVTALAADLIDCRRRSVQLRVDVARRRSSGTGSAAARLGGAPTACLPVVD